jgi:hypothetical protein
MNLSTLTYRFLTEDDLPKYLEFYDSMGTMFKTPTTIRQRNRLIENYNIENKKNIGVFDEDGNFVSVVSGYYPKHYRFWYCHNQFIRSENKSLSSYIEFSEIFHKSMKLLTQYGESNGYYGFYIRRLLSHQRGFEKLYNMAVDKGAIPETRYDSFYEAIYGSDSSTNVINHKLFFSNEFDEVVNATSVIVLYSLKQKFRVELLAKQHPEHF